MCFFRVVNLWVPNSSKGRPFSEVFDGCLGLGECDVTTTSIQGYVKPKTDVDIRLLRSKTRCLATNCERDWVKMWLSGHEIRSEKKRRFYSGILVVELARQLKPFQWEM